MIDVYPEIEPYAHGMLDVGDGNLVYWESCGNPDGKPVVVLHGGPGSGCSTGMRRVFNPDAYRIVLFDQRGCGRSTPHASDPATDLSVNTTEHLLADIELLRSHLGIERWVVFGGSWGCTLGLAYAERNPGRVLAMILVAVTTTRQSEIDWLYRGVAPMFPAAWDRFQAGVPEAERGGSMVEAYYKLLNHPDPAVREKASIDWCDWELSLVSVEPDAPRDPKYSNPDVRMCFARLVTHYFRNIAGLEDGIELREAYKLAGIPGVMVHGQIDFGSPLVTAWELAKAWPDAELVVVSRAGHSARDPGMKEALLAATEKVAGWE